MNFKFLKSTFEENPLFESKSWKYSPSPFPLSLEQYQEIKDIGVACCEFYQTLNFLYFASYNNQSILRNKKYFVPWITRYYNYGKSDLLIKHALISRLKKETPVLMRPDLLLTDDGFKLTEMDSVPGGFGLTTFLHKLYFDANQEIQFDMNSLLDLYYHSLAQLTPKINEPNICIVISDESKTYRPEFEFIANELRKKGKYIFCCHPDELPQHLSSVHIIYRFFELFDLDNIKTSQDIFDFVESKKGIVTPPMKHYQEEKLSLALFHHYRLKEFWKERLTEQSYNVLNKIIPQTWILDPEEAGANACLWGPWVSGNPLQNWEEIGAISQKERSYIIKVSGFHENAWGARSVTLGTDVSQEIWMKAIQEALIDFSSSPYVIQEYHKPKLTEHPIYQEDGSVSQKEGRTRICPYYFIKDKSPVTSCILATFCSKDKKIIHGMSDATLLPCSILS